MTRAKAGKKAGFIGRWRIIKMSDLGKDVVDEDVKAYILIAPRGTGEFQFACVTGDLDGEFKQQAEGILFDFTWDGSDECDHVFGDGWMKVGKGGLAQGEIRFHMGDKSFFWAKKMANQRTPRK